MDEREASIFMELIRRKLYLTVIDGRLRIPISQPTQQMMIREREKQVDQHMCDDIEFVSAFTAGVESSRVTEPLLAYFRTVEIHGC